MNYHDLTAVIVTHNSVQVLQDCLDPLKVLGIQTILVDNGSSDDTVPFVKEFFPETVLIQNRGNLGYGRANNIGLHRVKTKYALIMNPDVRINEKAVKELLNSFSGDQNIVVAVPAAHDSPSSENGCRAFPERPFDIRKNRPYQIRGSLLYISWFSGGCFAADVGKLIHQVGCFDENIFLFFEDDELSLRIRRSNLHIVLNPMADVRHIYQSSCGASEKLRQRRVWHFSWSYCYTSSLESRFKKINLKILCFLARCIIQVLALKEIRTNLIRLHACFSFIAGKKAFKDAGTPRF